MAYKNTPSIVMAKRNEPIDSADDFPTPPWATRALLNLSLRGADWTHSACWEPACGRGHMAKVLREKFEIVYATDLYDYGYGAKDYNFLLSRKPAPLVHWVITNPPFNQAEQFARRALVVSLFGVALLCRTSFVEGKRRHKNLFSKSPPTTIAQFVERVPMVKGRLDPAIASATSYAWFIWEALLMKPPYETRLIWIPPCRKELEKPGDYD